MIHDGVVPNKYEIPGSLARLDWMEQCIISPWMHYSQGAIDIIASAHPQKDIDSFDREGETVTEGGDTREKVTNY